MAQYVGCQVNVRKATRLDVEKAWAVIEGPYRYWWHRQWRFNEPVAVFGMLNPSTADRERNDPTSRLVIGHAKMWDLSGAIIVNLYAARSTDPEALGEMDDAVGDYNWDYVREACRIVKARPGSVFVAAWGTHRFARQAHSGFVAFVKAQGVGVSCLGVTKSGMPRHPLYAPRGELMPYGR